MKSGLSCDRSGEKFGLSCDRSGEKFGLSCDRFIEKFGLSCDRSLSEIASGSAVCHDTFVLVSASVAFLQNE